MLVAVDVVPYRAAPFSGIRGVTGLYDKVLLHVEECAVVVVVALAQLEEVLAQQGASLD